VPVNFLLALASSGNFKNTAHFSPLRGHSFSYCNRDFEAPKKIITINRHHRIYPREEQVALIKKKARNFAVYKVDSKKITDFKKMVAQTLQKHIFTAKC